MLPLLLVLTSLATAVLHLPLGKSKAAANFKRDTQSSVHANNYYYWMNVNVGNPVQQVQGFVDTGSSDFWVATPKTCNTNQQGQLMFGTLEINCNYTYNASYSETLVRNQTEFKASYVSGKSASGFFAQELMTFGDMAIDSMNLGVATQTTASPVIGISYPYGEGCVVWNPQDLSLDQSSCQPYSNFPMQLKEKGVITTASYSLWLNSASNGTGSITFGGVDHSLYTGQLTKLPVEKEVFSFDQDSGEVREYPQYTKLLVALTGISIHTPDGSESIMSGAIPALLDSGTPDCMVPSSVVEAFYKIFGIYQGSSDTASIGCGIPDNYTITFDFRGFQANISLAEFIRPLLTSGQETFDNQGNMLCSPGFESLDNTNYAIIGHNVLTSLFMVVDMDANEVALAAANPIPSNSSVESITSGIPSAVDAPSYSQEFALHLSVTQSPILSASFSQATDVSGDPHTALQTVLSGSATFTHATYSSASGGLSALGDSDPTSTSGYSTPSTDVSTSSETVVPVSDADPIGTQSVNSGSVGTNSDSGISSSSSTTAATVVNISAGRSSQQPPLYSNAASRPAMQGMIFTLLCIVI